MGLLATVTAILLIGTTVWLISTGDVKKLFLRVPQQIVLSSSPLPINESEKERADNNNKDEGENIEMEDKRVGEDDGVGYVMEDGLIGYDGEISSVSSSKNPLESFFDRLAVYLTKGSFILSSTYYSK